MKWKKLCLSSEWDACDGSDVLKLKLVMPDEVSHELDGFKVCCNPSALLELCDALHSTGVYLEWELDRILKGRIDQVTIGRRARQFRFWSPNGSRMTSPEVIRKDRPDRMLIAPDWYVHSGTDILALQIALPGLECIDVAYPEYAIAAYCPRDQTQFLARALHLTAFHLREAIADLETNYSKYKIGSALN